MASPNDGEQPWLKVLVIGAGLWLLTSISGPKDQKPKPKPVLPMPLADDFASDDPDVLAMAAMLRMSREMEAAGWTDAARVYREQASAPFPGTVARALDHIADEFAQARNDALALKLKRVARSFYDKVQVTV